MLAYSGDHIDALVCAASRGQISLEEAAMRALRELI
jgi:hypothetical protein